MITDHQTHLLSRGYFESILDRDAYPRSRRSEDGYEFEPRLGVQMALRDEHFEIDLHLASMDAAGIDVMVSSPCPVGEVDRLELLEARETAGLANEETARLQREHPSRFRGLAMLPLQDTEAALQELDHGVAELGLGGVCMLANVGGAPLVSPETVPVFERIDELGVPLFLHPASVSSAFTPALGSVVEVGLNWMWETSVAALSLITTGVLDRCPRLTVVHPHLGGVLPYVLGRVANVDRMTSTAQGPGGHARRPEGANELPVARYLRERFYVDIVGATPGSISLAAQTYGVSRLLFGTDFPWLPARDRLLEYVRSELAEEDAETVLHNSLPGLRLDEDEKAEAPAAES